MRVCTWALHSLNNLKESTLILSGRFDTVQIEDARFEFALSAVTWMAHCHCVNPQLGKGRLCVATNRNNAAWREHIEKRQQERLACFALRSGVAAIGHRLARLVWMEGEHIPQKEAAVDVVYDVPNDRGRAFRYDGATRRTLDWQAAK